MWKGRRHPPVGVGTQQSSRQGDEHDVRATANQRVNRSWTGTGERPANAEEGAANPIPLHAVHGEAFCFERLSGQILDLKAVDQKEAQGSDDDRGSDHAVHMEGLKMKHLLDAIP